MLNGRTAVVILIIGCFVVGAGFAQNQAADPNATVAPAAGQNQAAPAAAGAQETGPALADNWNDFLHYVKIGRFDLAKGFGQAILQNKPNPAELFALVQANQQGYDLAMKVAEAARDEELTKVTEQLLSAIDQGRFLQRSEPRIIVDEIRRLSSTPRGKLAAMKRLRDAGEYAVSTRCRSCWMRWPR